MKSGWIKTYRQLVDWEWYQDSQMVHLLIHLIIQANHADLKWRGITIKRGQLLTSRKKLSVETGISEQSIRTCLDRLQSTNEITVKSTNLNTVITINKYDIYQANETEINQPNNQPDNQQSTSQTTNDQPTTNQPTNKNYKNYKNNIIDTNVSTSNEQAHTTSHDGIDYKKLIDFFNKKTNGVFGNVRYPVSESRKGMIRARIREHGKEAFAEMIEKSMNSNFLKGDNKSGWKAKFDWMIRPTNFQKIIEGNYNNSQTHNDSLLTYEQVVVMANKGEATFDQFTKIQTDGGKVYWKRK